MSKHGTLYCAKAGCRETGSFEYRNQQEWAERKGRDWFCARHRDESRNLSTEDRERVACLVVVQKDYGRFWVEEGQTVGGSGLVSGPGYKAFAEDFAEGTTLTISASIAAPTSETTDA